MLKRGAAGPLDKMKIQRWLKVKTIMEVAVVMELELRVYRFVFSYFISDIRLRFD